ncbi:hypothetical protein NDU88_006347 [Pleurodeles waltl]|uniref:Uncharacterized protein n=1 Tax=Pleurodeles waltl TaxID=8319 RepID=A0AAV7TDQ4_PLEWA|nr:hypothetical protein NDU88_006347 [Pleurodeles waltl]
MLRFVTLRSEDSEEQWTADRGGRRPRPRTRRTADPSRGLSSHLAVGPTSQETVETAGGSSGEVVPSGGHDHEHSELELLGPTSSEAAEATEERLVAWHRGGWGAKCGGRKLQIPAGGRPLSLQRDAPTGLVAAETN